MSKKHINESHAKYIDDLGGSTAVASIFGIKPQAVSKWKKSGIPNPNLMYLREKYPSVPFSEEKAA